MRPKLVQFGAGKIGRSFIGQLFSRAGYEVVFVEVDAELVRALKARRRYRVVIKDAVEEEIWVENVRAVPAGDTAQAAEETAAADIAATAVGAEALDSVYPLIAAGLLRRRELGGGPLDILICENLRAASQVFREGLTRHLPDDFDIDARVGLVETSIGKMVPLISDDARRRDPLVVYAEAYNTLIVDRRGFKMPLPAVPGLDAKGNMAAYVDRKLFIHNLGHAAVAWLGFVAHPERAYLWEALEDSRVLQAARGAMWESALALIAAYPAEFDRANQAENIEDLLRRFRNRKLGDTVYRVGRHLERKLAPQERVMGSLRLQMEHGIEPRATVGALAAALLFGAVGDDGEELAEDARLRAAVERLGPRAVLADVCGLDSRARGDAEIIERAAGLYHCLRDAQQRGQTLDELAAAGRPLIPPG